MKIQPVDSNEALRPNTAVKPVFKSRLKRLFESPFAGVLKVSSPEKPADFVNIHIRDASEEFEPCLAKMVQNFIEDSNERHHHKCGRNRYNCFNGHSTDSSDDEEHSYKSSLSDASDVLKQRLVPCVSASERTLLVDVSRLVESDKISKLKHSLCRRTVVEGLIAFGYNASLCKSKWAKSPICPPGGHEYLDVVILGDRLIIDTDFRSEFEIARSTKDYRLLLQMLPTIFVGKASRLEKIIDVVSEAAKQSLKKKGMAFPPWRKADYMKAKWLSPFTRISPSSSRTESPFVIQSNEHVRVQKWLPPLEFKPRILGAPNRSVKVKTGLASIIEDQIKI